MAAFTANQVDADAHGLKPKHSQLPSSPRRTGQSPRAWAAIWKKRSRPAAEGRTPPSSRGAGSSALRTLPPSVRRTRTAVLKA